MPIYQAAAQAYDLGPPGPSILAAINEIESGFGQNLGPSSAGAVGWMQFMPSDLGDLWRRRGPRRRSRTRTNANDAIFAAARVPAGSRDAGGPRGARLRVQPRRLVCVAEVMARAACFSGIGNGAVGGLSLIPKRQELVCAPGRRTRRSRSRTTT